MGDYSHKIVQVEEFSLHHLCPLKKYKLFFDLLKIS